MFISNTHKNLIDNRIKNLEIKVELLMGNMEALSAQLAAFSQQSTAKIAKPNKDRKSHNWSEEKRAAQSARMKAKWLEKKAAKEQGAAS
jgi:hypothetical protein